MPEEIVLYEGDEDNDDITAQISAGYDVMLTQVKDNLEGDGNAEFARQLEEMVHRSVQAQQGNNSEEIHPAYAQLIRSMQETGEVDLDALVENTIHTVSQQQSAERQ